MGSYLDYNVLLTRFYIEYREHYYFIVSYRNVSSGGASLDLKKVRAGQLCIGPGAGQVGSSELGPTGCRFCSDL